MAESLKIIHICNHIIRENFEELKTVEINRMEERYDDSIPCKDKRLMYYGDWTLDTQNPSNEYYKTSTAGNKVKINFYGDNITIYSKKMPNAGNASIYIDGDYFGTMDLYHSETINKEPIIQLTDMIHGVHMIEVELKSTKNPSSTGTVLAIESALIKDSIVVETNPYDIVSIGDVVKQINYINQTIGDKVVEYKNNSDYRLVGGNKIKWLGLNRPNPKHKYEVEYIRKFSKSQTYKPSTCTRCYGMGWYGAFNSLETKLPEKTTGIFKIAEDIIKILLTPLSDNGYGSTFLDMNKQLYTDATLVEDTALSEISRIERYYKSIQSEEIAKGATYTSDDILYAIIVNKVNFNTGTSTLSIELTVYNNTGQSHDANVVI